MSDRNPASTFARELRLLYRSYPNVTLEEVAATLPGPATSPSAGWQDQMSPILTCAQAFGDSRNFQSKDEAIRILRDELNVEGNCANLRWNQLPGAAALALLSLPPSTAEELMRRHQFKTTSPPPSKARRSRSRSNTVDTVAGIIHAKDT